MSTPEKITALLEHLEKNPNPNFTQYQLAIDEITRIDSHKESAKISDAYALHAVKKLRHTLEARYRLASLDDTVGQ